MKNSVSKYRIMGIDPGTNYMGYGIVEVEGNTLRSVVMGDIDLHTMSDPYRKLNYIFKRVGKLNPERIFTVDDSLCNIKRKGEISSLVFAYGSAVYIYPTHLVYCAKIDKDPAFYKALGERKGALIIAVLVAIYTHLNSREGALRAKGNQYLCVYFRLFTA